MSPEELAEVLDAGAERARSFEYNIQAQVAAVVLEAMAGKTREIGLREPERDI